MRAVEYFPHVRPAERKLDVAALGELAVAGIAVDLQDPLEAVEMGDSMRPSPMKRVRPSLADWVGQAAYFHGAIALLTLCMTLFIQRSEHRDTQAIQAKLDELVRANSNARSGLTKLDELEPEEIEAHRDRAKTRD